MDNATTVESVVKTFYSGGGNEAHSMLLQFQASREAWSFVWPLLNPTKPWEVQFFAATTLQTKICKQWNEVPESEYSTLKKNILSVLKAPTTPKLILNKLCEAYSTFLVNIYINIEKDDKFGCLLDELITILPYNSLITLPIHLRVLSSIFIDISKRKAFSITDHTTFLLQQIFTSIDQLLLSKNHDHSLYLLILDCVLSWMKLDPSIDAINQIFPHILTIATRYVHETAHQVWQATQDCLMMIVTREIRGQPQYFWEWSRAIVTAAHETNNSTAFMSLLCNLADTHSRIILLALAQKNINEQQRWTVETLIELFLQCSEDSRRYPIDELTSALPFGFWYTLQDDLSTLDAPIEQRARLALQPIYARLTQALLRKSTLPLTTSEAGDADARELFRCYRQDTADTLVYCYNVIDNELLIILGQRFITTTDKWNDVEATIYAFQALSDCVEPNETNYIPELMNILLTQIPYERYPQEVLATACSTVASYAEWIGENPQPSLNAALQLISRGLIGGPITATSASMALKDISRECMPHLAPLAPSILHAISTTLNCLPPGSGDGLRLMYAAGKLLNSLPSMDQQLQHLDATLGICVTRIQTLLQFKSDDSSNNLKLALVNNLKMATMFLSTLEGAMGKSVLSALLPIFQHIVGHNEWSQDEMILEAMFSCAHRSLQCLLHPETDIQPLLPLLITSYKIRPHPAALDFLRQVILLLASNGQLITPIFAEISAYSLVGFNACRQAGGDLSTYADLLEAYFKLLAQVCRKTPKLILQVPDHIPEMLHYGIIGLSLPEASVIKAAALFLSNAIAQLEHLAVFINAIGPELISMLLDCIIGRTYRNNLESHAKVLIALNKHLKAQTVQWIKADLGARNLPIAPNVKDSFIKKLMSERNSTTLTETLQKFSLHCHIPVVGI